MDNVEEKFDLAMRSNKWEGEDEEEEVKVKRFLVAYATRGRSHASPRAVPRDLTYKEHMFPLVVVIIEFLASSFAPSVRATRAIPCDCILPREKDE